MMKKRLLLCLLALIMLVRVGLSQDRTISGKVTDRQNNQGLPGVTVLAKGTTKGASTNADGTYSLEVPASANTLQFSFVGYRSVERSIGNNTTIDVALEVDTKQLNEVVVTALGIEREKKALGYSTQDVRGDALVQSGEKNIVEGLAGKVAGVQVIGSAGTPGASSKILIRGNNSFTGENQPLFVIDGIPLDNSYSVTEGQDYPFNANLNGVGYSNRAIDINPNDIETMTVLKGPAAAALYGVRAGNGAVVITTKRGRAGQKPSVSFRTEQEFSQVNRTLDQQFKYAQGVGGGNQRNASGGIVTPSYVTWTAGDDGIFETEDDNIGTTQIWGPTNESLGITPTDNVDKFFRTGFSTTNDIAVSAGNERGAVRFSLGQLHNEGIVPETKFDRYTLRLSADTKLSEKVDAAGTINYANTGGTRAQQGSNVSGVMLGLMRAPSSFDLAAGYENPDGTPRNYFQGYDNPYWTVNNNPTKDDNSRVLGNITLTYKPLPWLRITERGGADIFTDRRKTVFAVYSNDPPEPTGEIRENTQYHRELYNDLIANATHDFSEKLFGSLTVGGNLDERYDQSLFARGRNLAVPKFYNLSNASDRYADEQRTTIRTGALYYDANVSFNETFFLGTTGRYETASTFGPDFKGFFNPSVNASVVLSELGGLKDIGLLNFLKIRGAYARGGNIPPAYGTRTYFLAPFFTDGFTNGLSFPYLGQNGSGLGSTLGNSNLKPEVVISREVGAEVRLNDNRITIDFTYYHNNSKDLIVARPVSSGSGYLASLENVGEIQNKGIEAVVTLVPFRSENGFNWDMLFNFTRNRSKVLALAEGIEQLQIEAAFDISAYAIVGQPYGVLYGTRWERNENGDLLIQANGLPRLAATTGNVGNPYPDYTLGIRNNFSYKKLNLSALFDIRKGGAIWNGTTARLNRLGISKITEDRDRDYVIPGVKTDGSPNDIAIPAFTYFQRYLGDNGGAQETQVQEGSWVRLREVTLSYNFGQPKFLSFVRGLELYAAATNLWLKTDYTGIDPETSLTGSGSNITGFDYFNMPNTRNYRFGLKANF
ncbi:SusC/RagA family TonB-linked outer membrane protein [Hymenobacter sp. DG25A]|uniref:SusC/RagA family TonB-linked outer membrane protein n=1 Tax=Hymenobacter sp. DG25A TaxID=1385663 RepID=UPI0009E78E20|nr:SusC/RagA family TonB-linked outer membrane protein [Hymenobacter sp. DG25A]